MSNIFRGLAVVCILTLGFSFAARADDFIKECKAGTPGPDADKVCTCMSGKVSGADRVAAIDGMSKSNAASAKGGQLDPSSLTPQQVKGLETVVTAESACH